MRNIDPYDSRYPSEYYEIGTIYSFYASPNMGNFHPADAKYISKYSSALLKLQEEEKTILFHCRDFMVLSLINHIRM